VPNVAAAGDAEITDERACGCDLSVLDVTCDVARNAEHERRGRDL
jgi:hypothetical protein